MVWGSSQASWKALTFKILKYDIYDIEYAMNKVLNHDPEFEDLQIPVDVRLENLVDYKSYLTLTKILLFLQIMEKMELISK